MLPQFLVLGVAKSGTTSLYYYLQEHPAISIPKKETFYFIRDFYKTLPSDERGQRDMKRVIMNESEYHSLYENCNGIAGEVSTCYFSYHEMAYPEIKKKLGNPKMIVILRNPVERAFSAWRYHVSLKLEDLSFEDALEKEQLRKNAHWDFMWYYKEMGFYFEAAKKTYESFSNVKFILHDELEADPSSVMKALFQFLNVDADVKIDTTVKYNISDRQDDRFLFKNVLQNETVKKMLRPVAEMMMSDSRKMKVIHKLRKENTDRPLMDAETRSMLQRDYRNDVLNLQDLIKKDLSRWL